MLALVAVAFSLVARGGVFFSQWVPDLFIPLEGVAHLDAGQWPHRDFVTPVGSLWYAIHLLPTLVMPLSARVVVWANLIVALVAGLSAFVVCTGKMPRWMVGLCTFYSGLVALSPRQIGESFQHISNNASYNRHCWALICALALAALIPAPDRSRRRELIDGLITGLLIAACFYIKVTYAAAGIGFVGLSLFSTRGTAGWRFAVISGASALVTVLGVGLLTNDLPGYFTDMKTAITVLPDSTRSNQAAALFLHELPSLILAGMLSFFAAAVPDRMFGRYTPGVLAGVLTVTAGLVIGVQNHPEPENPLLPIGILIGWITVRSRVQGPYRFSRNFGHLAVTASFLIPIVMDMAAIGWTATAPFDASPATAWLSNTPMADIKIGARYTGGDPVEPLIPRGDIEIMSRWREAFDLLRPRLQGRDDVKILPFTWSNPFPLLMKQPAVRHEVAWWDAQRTFNARIKPSPDQLLDNVDYVLVPHDYVNPTTALTMWESYGSTLQRDFKPVAHTPHWDLWAKRICASRGLC